MKVVDFYKLPRSIQDRFVGSVMSGFPPAPMLAHRAGTPKKVLWLGVSAGSLLGLVILARLGYGSLETGLSIHSVKAVPLYLGLFFGIVLGVVQAWAQLVRERALPYRAGVYAFPACVIDARSDQFKVHDTKDLSAVDVVGGAVRLAFGGGVQILFPLSGTQAPQDAVTEVQEGRERAMQARATEDAGELVSVDPLHNPRFSSPVGPRDPYALRRPTWGKHGWAIAAAFALVFGPSIWALRNNGSDKTMYARATQANDTAAYRRYLEHGQRSKAEVSAVLLPRAELRDAEKQGTVDALLAFKASHPGTLIGPELTLSIRTAMLAELEKAKAVGTLAALEAFAKTYPDHGVEPELREAKHAVYARDLEGYKKRTPNKDKAVLPLVERLFAWAEKNGPRVEVRFRRKKSDSMGRADQAIAKSASFMGEVSYPSKYFDEKHAVKREQVLGKVLTTRLDAGFSPELFDLQVGAPVLPDAEGLPDVKVPTLFISHGVEWSGASYTTPRPRGVYVGVIFPFEATFVIPGEPKPFKLKSDVLKHAAIGLLRDSEEMIQPGAAEEKVYDATATDAFDQFGNKVLAVFFKPADKPEK